MMLKASIAGRNWLEVSFSAMPEEWVARLPASPGVESVERHDTVFRISTAQGPQTTQALLNAARAAGIGVSTLSVQSTTLDDVFVHYTGRALRDALQEASAMDSPFMLRRN
jgi:ABC-2 type transport system ATP-binding protein